MSRRRTSRGARAAGAGGGRERLPRTPDQLRAVGAGAVLSACLAAFVVACTPGEPPVAAHALVDYYAIGTIAGRDDHLVVLPDGRSTLTLGSRTRYTFVLPRNMLARLREVLGTDPVDDPSDPIDYPDAGSIRLVYRPARGGGRTREQASGSAYDLLNAITGKAGRSLVVLGMPVGRKSRVRQLTINRDGRAFTSTLPYRSGDPETPELGLAAEELASLERALDRSNLRGRLIASYSDLGRFGDRGFEVLYDFHVASARERAQLPLSEPALRELRRIDRRLAQAGERTDGTTD